jgi:hypothetical protein
LVGSKLNHRYSETMKSTTAVAVAMMRIPRVAVLFTKNRMNSAPISGM